MKLGIIVCLCLVFRKIYVREINGSLEFEIAATYIPSSNRCFEEYKEHLEKLLHSADSSYYRKGIVVNEKHVVDPFIVITSMLIRVYIRSTRVRTKEIFLTN